MSVYWWPEGKKLIYTKEEAPADFWDRQWQTEDWKKRITKSRNSRYWSSILKKYLPDKKARILEGGCGDGHLMDAMNYWGYQAVGSDFTRKADVRTLNYKKGHFDGYWSLRVIEHLWEGYGGIINEMRQVLKVGGYGFVIFPCISRLDRVKIFFSGYRKYTGFDKPDHFYQFALDAKIVKKNFKYAGFKCMRSRRRNGWDGLKRLWPAIEPVHRVLFRLSKKNRLVKLLTLGTGVLMAPLCGHDALLVLRKK